MRNEYGARLVYLLLPNGWITLSTIWLSLSAVVSFLLVRFDIDLRLGADFFTAARLAPARFAALRLGAAFFATAFLPAARFAILRRFGAAFFATARLPAARFAVLRLAPAFLATERLAVVRFATARFAVLRLAVVFFAAERLRAPAFFTVRFFIRTPFYEVTKYYLLL